MYNELPALKQHKLYLQDFWERYGGIGNRKGVSPFGKVATITDFVRLGEVRLMYNSSHDRKMFDRRKNKRKKFLGFTHCFACGGRAEVRHHIIWLSRGGRNQKNNVAGLCRPCHALVHPWLR